MSSYNLNTILRLYVNEQVYLFWCLPASECVFKTVENGSFCKSFRTSESFSSIAGEFFMSLFAFLMKCFSKTSWGKSFSPVPDSIHSFINCIKSNSVGFTFNLIKAVFKGFAFFAFIYKISRKVSQLLNVSFGKQRQHFFDMFYFGSSVFHTNIISQVQQGR